MAKFEVVRDIAILDKGVDTIDRFVSIEDIEVDRLGRTKDIEVIKKALSSLAVQEGATRINLSNCVDISEGGAVARDDQILVFNGGDIIYTSLQSGLSYEKFMIKEGLLIPLKK